MTKKIALFLVIVCMTVASPKTFAQFRYGPMVGVDVSNLHFRQHIVDVDRVPGFSAGVLGEMMFPGIGFGIDTGLYYAMRGAKLHLEDKLMWSSQGYGVPRLYIHEFVIPFHLRFKFVRLQGLEDNLAPFLSVGPSMGFQVGHSKLDAFSFAGADLCLDFTAGLELKRHWQVSAGYTLGMTYITKAKIMTNYSARNRAWCFRLAYLF
ncbi:MAG: PorT family protein [Bacteroidales bacterium]|nr:PorT family protein [Bacteroidales bacterium]